MAGNENDSEADYWEKLGFRVKRDSKSGELVAEDKWGELKRKESETNIPAKPPLVSDPRTKNRAMYPGKGATDAQWRRFASDKYEFPGAQVEVPKIGSGKRRGLDILRMIRGESVVTRWNCGCWDRDGEYHPCGTGSCDANPD